MKLRNRIITNKSNIDDDRIIEDRNRIITNKSNIDKNQLLLEFKDTFKSYRSLLTKEQLVSNYPWCNERITYNYILTSYRQPNNSIKSCILSLFMIHNELINQWTHIIGAITTLCQLIITLATVTDIEASVVLSIYCILGTFMFSSSVSYHIFCCHSDHGSRVVQCMDWFGIALMTFACNLVSSYFELREFRTALYIFTVFNFIFGILSYSFTYSALSEVYLSADIQKGVKTIEKGKDDNRPKLLQQIVAMMETYAFRTIVAVFYGLGSVIAWITGFVLRGFINDNLFWMIMMYVCYLTVALCLFDLPESLAPVGTFDIIGYSHQIFHIGIFAGVVSQWIYFYTLQINTT